MEIVTDNSDWCTDCLYYNTKCECMCTRPCENGSQKVKYKEDDDGQYKLHRNT